MKGLQRLGLMAMMLAAALLFAIPDAEGQGLNRGGKKVEFVFPVGIDANKTATFPTCGTQETTTGSTVAFSTFEYTSHVVVDSLVANKTINCTVESHVTDGAILLLEVEANDNYVLTFGTGFNSPTIQADSAGTKIIQFILISDEYVPVSSFVID